MIFFSDRYTDVSKQPSQTDRKTQQRSQKTLEKLTGRTVRLTYKVEPAIIGGAVTTVGSTVYDGSVRMQLAQLRRQMAQE
mgnify:CR=1 FL=1